MRKTADLIKMIPGPVLKAVSMLEDAGFEAYIVGGAVRDMLLGKAPHDFDITTSAMPEEVTEVFSCFKVIPTGIKHGTVTVIIEGSALEITAFREDGVYADHRHPDTVKFTRSLSEDLKRRDFTVNAMAFSPRRGVIDENGGVEDLENRVIRAVGDPEKRFSEDALRILRAVRFSCRLGFDIEEKTFLAAVERRRDLSGISNERINAELCGILLSENSRQLEKTLLGRGREILFEIIPELRQAEKTPQINSFHCCDVYTHTVKALAASENDLTVRTAMLLHDIGKPYVLKYGEDGTTHFKGHCDVGADMAEAILKRLRFPVKFTASVVKLIKYHEFFRDPYMKQGDYRTAAGKLLRLTGEQDSLKLIDVMLADAKGKKPSYEAVSVDSTLKLKDELLKLLASGGYVAGPKNLKVTGKDLAGAGIPEDGSMGAVISHLTEQASEFKVLNDKNELLKLAKKIYTEEIVVDKKHKLAKSRFEIWSKDPYFDEETRNELLEISGNDEIYDRFYKGLEFGTAGLRGVMGAGTNRMNIYVVRRTSYALAEYIKSFGREIQDRGIVVSYDTRNNSRTYAKEAASVFAACGIKAYMFKEPAPVPVLSYTVWSGNYISGVMITASHNPKQYNGYKVYWEGGVQIAPHMAEEITKIIDKYDDIRTLKPQSFNSLLRSGRLEYVPDEVIGGFTDRVTSIKADKDLVRDHSDRLCVVYSPLYGSGAKYIKKAFDKLGFKNFHMVRRETGHDGNFPGLSVPNPENPDAYVNAVKLAKRLKADLVFATDPDSDRMGACVRTKDGGYKNLTGNQIGSLLMNYIIGVRKRNGCLPKDAFAVSTIVSTDLAGIIANENGVEFKSVLTGFKFIGDLITEENKDSFILGFEESYGFLTEGYARDKDGVAASIALCEMALYYKVNGNLSLLEVLDGLYKKYGYRSESAFSVELPGEAGHESIVKIMKAFRNAGREVISKKITRIDDIYEGISRSFTDGAEDTVKDIDLPRSDVLKYYYEDGWFAIRPSGTEPKIKIYVGVKDPVSVEKAAEKAEALKKELKEKINGFLK